MPQSIEEVPTIAPVIMSGGAGTRLWPVSTHNAPKQFHALGSERTLFQDTVLRVCGTDSVSFLPPIIIGNVGHQDAIFSQLRQIQVDPAFVVLEPIARNTAVVAALAARITQQLYPGSLALLLPADHVIADPDGFRTTVSRAAHVAHERIVTFGIAPTAPETGYGYIQRGPQLAPGVFAIAEFAEKPPREKAEAYLADGRYYWNAGIFLFSPALMLSELREHQPAIFSAADTAFEAAQRRGNIATLDAESLAACPSESIDRAVMERTTRGGVAPCSIGWADLGSWNEIWRVGKHDTAGNMVHGAAVALDTRDSLIWSDGIPVAVVGLEQVIVVASGSGVIVLPQARAQEVKEAVVALEQLQKRRADP